MQTPMYIYIYGDCGGDTSLREKAKVAIIIIRLLLAQ